jgi:hypothetical protein
MPERREAKRARARDPKRDTRYGRCNLAGNIRIRPLSGQIEASADGQPGKIPGPGVSTLFGSNRLFAALNAFHAGPIC